MMMYGIAGASWWKTDGTNQQHHGASPGVRRRLLQPWLPGGNLHDDHSINFFWILKMIIELRDGMGMVRGVGWGGLLTVVFLWNHGRATAVSVTTDLYHTIPYITQCEHWQLAAIKRHIRLWDRSVARWYGSLLTINVYLSGIVHGFYDVLFSLVYTLWIGM